MQEPRRVGYRRCVLSDNHPEQELNEDDFLLSCCFSARRLWTILQPKGCPSECPNLKLPAPCKEYCLNLQSRRQESHDPGGAMKQPGFLHVLAASFSDVSSPVCPASRGCLVGLLIGNHKVLSWVKDAKCSQPFGRHSRALQMDSSR